MTDVNAGFDAERAFQVARISDYNDQATAWNALSPEERATQEMAGAVARFEERVAAGELRNLGGGRYEVTTGFDRGEVFYVQRSAGNLRQLMVMPEAGLDTKADGTAALYSRYPEWHNLGTIIPAGLSSIPGVLKAAGLDFEVEQRPSGMWRPFTEDELAARQEQYDWSDDQLDGIATGEFVEVPGQFVNYRTDSGAPFAVVGKIYTPIQPAQSMAFLQGLIDDDSVIIESAGCMAGGARIFITCLLPQTMVIDAEGIADEVQMHIAVIDRYDGNGKFLAIATPWRIRCGNTERFALRDAVARWGIRHTTTAPQRVAEAQRTLGLTNKYAERFVAEETALARTELTSDDFSELMAEVWGERDLVKESKKSATIANRREEGLRGLFSLYSGELGQTAYSAERAVTDWLDHVAPRRISDKDKLAAARATAALEGSDDDRKAAAHTALMRRVR
jgi:phage/plasmid-like protein (TIGR03299 family)